MEVYTHRIPEYSQKEKLVDYIIGKLPLLDTKSSVKKAIVTHQLFVDGRTAGLHEIIDGGQVIEHRVEPKRKVNVRLPKLPVAYEDDHCIIVEKVGGIATNGNRNKTVENAVAQHAKRSREPDVLPFPSPVHRLDVPTSGLVILAKTKRFQSRIGDLLQSKGVKKKYFAVVHGKLEGDGRIKKPIEGKNSETLYTTKRVVPSVNFGHLSLLDIELVTGRTHQIRKHFTSIDHPVAGDKLYGRPRKRLEGKGLLLCAYFVEFIHPITNEKVKAVMEVPGKFEKVLDREESFYRKSRSGR